MTEESAVCVGWREWVALPEFDLPAIKAKIDTGARSSAIHAFDIEQSTDETGRDWVEFSVHPLQRDDVIVRRCRAPLVDIRRVTDSGGHSEQRLFVQTELVFGPVRRRIEITLTQRRDMLFRMLVGRTALKPDTLVDPSRSFLCGRVAARSLYTDSGASS